MRKPLIIGLIAVLALLAAIGLGTWLWPGRDTSPTTSPRELPPNPIASKSFSHDDLPAKASCTLQGTLRYTDPATYRHENSKLIYKGVDDQSRHIFWKVTPEDDFRIGPNIFDRLSLPDGETLIIAVAPDDPVATQYTLTASIGYGRLDRDGILRTFTTQCKGNTTIKLAP